MYYDLSLLFVYFLLYAMIGWMCEVVYCFILSKKFINRGFLNGPYCPIYGVGGLIIITFLIPYVKDPILVFFIGIILTSALEYVTSWGMEKLFHAKWWDYSEHKYNINGRVCLLNSLLFGILCLLLMYGVHPIVDDFVGSISTSWILVISIIAALIFFSDVVESVRQTVSFNQKLKSAYDTATEFKVELKEKGIETAQEVTLRIRDLKKETLVEVKDLSQYLFKALSRQIDETKKIDRLSYRRIISAFPKMAHPDHQNSLDIYKAYLEKNHLKKKDSNGS